MDLERVLEKAIQEGSLQPPLLLDREFQGNLNRILRFRDKSGAWFALRVRVREAHYRYEPGVLKEVVVHQWIEKLLGERAATFIPRPPRPICFDTTRRTLPHPWIVYPWQDGIPLWDTPSPALYEEAGRWLQALHSIRPPSDWFGSSLVSQEPLAASSELGERALLHNDFSGANLLVNQDRIVALIDWDNAIFGDPFLDLVKMRYWTRVKDDGELGFDAGLFSAFLRGYGKSELTPSEQDRALHQERIWLERVLDFELGREAAGLPAPKPYPRRDRIQEWLRELNQKTAGRAWSHR